MEAKRAIEIQGGAGTGTYPITSNGPQGQARIGAIHGARAALRDPGFYPNGVSQRKESSVK